MLNKIYYYRNNQDDKVNTSMVNSKELSLALSSYLKKKYSSVTVFPVEVNSTLGVFFSANINGKEFFIKTHLNGDLFRNSLVKETIIYSMLYKDYLHTERIDIDDQVFLLMDKLSELSGNPGINGVKDIIEKYSTVFTPPPPQ